MDLEEIGRKLDQILELLDRGSVGDDDRRSKYPWHLLETEGRFLVECGHADKVKIQASVHAGANRRFGKGAVHVLQKSKGVLVLKKGFVK